MIKWEPISTAPVDEEIVVIGHSGMIPPHNKFMINAYYDSDKEGWLDAQRTRLSDAGWKPQYWSHLPQMPPMELI